MEPLPPILFFDYVDPLAYLVDRELSALAEEPGVPRVRRVPLEICPPPAPMLDPEGSAWRHRWDTALTAAARLGLVLAEPPLIPWTRKAHELVLHAVAKGVGENAHRSVFEAVFARGLDVGRVDVLVALAEELGLAAQETKAVLDVDRYAEEVAAGRALAARTGVSASPTLVWDTEMLQGFHNGGALRTFLLR